MGIPPSYWPERRTVWNRYIVARNAPRSSPADSMGCANGRVQFANTAGAQYYTVLLVALIPFMCPLLRLSLSQDSTRARNLLILLTRLCSILRKAKVPMK
jgi:hypothetical protein